MKILFYLQSMIAGGAQRVVATLSNYWIEQNWQITIVTLAETTTDFYTLDARIRRVSLDPASGAETVDSGVIANVRRIRRLRDLLRDSSPDVAVAMMDTANVVLALSGMGLPILLIGSERIFPPCSEVPWHWHRARNFGYRYLRAVVAQTSQTAEWLRMHTCAREVRVIANPIQLPLDQHEPFILPPVVREVRRLLSVGRLVPQKNFSALIDAFARIAAEASEWQLVIVGDGPQRTALTAQAERLGVAGRVLFAGRAGNAGDWYACADLFAMSSDFEGFPNTLLEALAHGVPVVSFDCPSGPRDLIRDGVDGFLVAPGDVATFTSMLRRLMLDDILRAQFALCARDVVNRFAVAKIAGEWESIFDELGAGIGE